MLTAADHLLAHVCSNALLTRPRDCSGQRPKGLVQYLDSLLAYARWRWTWCYEATAIPATHHRESRYARSRSGNGPPTRSLRRCAAYRPDPALPDAVRGARAPRRLEADGRVREFARDGVNVCELA
jgi:hypothetical protein